MIMAGNIETKTIFCKNILDINLVSGIVVGVVSIKETDSIGDKKTCKVSRLYVHPNCRRLGVASKLLQAAKIEALKLGYKMLKVECIEKSSFMYIK